MVDSLQNSPFEDGPKRRTNMMELRSRKLVGSATSEVEIQAESSNRSNAFDGSSQSFNQSTAKSSSLEDLDASIDGDDSRRSVEPELQLENDHSQDQSSARRNSSFTDPKPTTPRKESPKVKPECAAGPLQNSNSSLLVLSGVILFVIAAVATPMLMPSKSSPVQHCNQFVTVLRPKYPTIDPIMWTTLNVSVNRALYRKPSEPSTFVFLYDSTTVQKSLIEDVIDITSRCFDGTQPIRLTSADFETPEIAADYGAFLQQYKQPLEERGIMVVQNLDQVPAKAARALFTICDSYGPLVERAVIFFTIDISRRTQDLDQSPTALAEKLLQDQWRSGLRGDTLDPLLVRLTENVFKII